LKSKEPKLYDNKLNMACLARTFYPKNISLDVPKNDIVYDLKAPLVTSEGIYSTMKVVGVESDAEFTCRAMYKGNNSTASIILPGTVLRSKDNTIMGDKVNMLLVSILGLRVLLAKSIAFNTIMSIRLFLF
ncbi:TRDC protein, partial [Ibidorhyncha struthersii]|nr:TRDC protein [Ibidorhyncha struthersii]